MADMALPEELTYVTVTGTIQGARDGELVTAIFRSPAWLYGGADNLIVPSFAVSAAGDADGVFSVQLPATDDPQWAPQDWAYGVVLKCGSREQRGTITVPAATVGSLDLADIFNPDGSAEQGVVYLLASTRGTAGGVAALDADGQVLDGSGNPVTGGGGGGGTPSNTVISETSYGQSADDGAATTYSRGDHTHGTPPAPTYAQVTGKPSTFAPSAHASSHGDGGADEVSIDGSQITSGSVAFARLPTGTGSTQVAVGNHTHAGGSGVTPTFARARVTTGDIAPPSDATMAPLAGGPTLSIAAVAGDNLEVDLNCLIDRSASAGSDTYDLAIINGSTVIRFASTGTASEPGSGEGDPSLYPNTRFQPAVTHWSLAVESGDIVGGSVTFALCHKGAGSGKVYASTVFPFRWSVGNFKQ